jgi:hypothetical protein
LFGSRHVLSNASGHRTRITLYLPSRAFRTVPGVERLPGQQTEIREEIDDTKSEAQEAGPQRCEYTSKRRAAGYVRYVK